MSQTTYLDNQEAGFPGMLADNIHTDIVSRINNSKQTISTTITAADLSTTLTINGTAFNVNSGAAVKTKTELRDLLIAAINAGSEPVTASINDADELYVEADVSGTAFTYADTLNVSSADLILNETSVEFGQVVTQDNEAGTKEKRAHLPMIATDITNEKKVLGVAIHQHTVMQNKPTVNNKGYEPQSAISVLKKGNVWVETEVVVTTTDDVYVRYSASGSEKRGAFRNDADTADAAILPNARFAQDSVVIDGKNMTIVNINLV